MSKKYYATGNAGNGTVVYSFESQKERNHFVAWDDKYAQRRAVTRNHARRWYSVAHTFDGDPVITL